jgi:hypothetical protein
MFVFVVATHRYFAGILMTQPGSKVRSLRSAVYVLVAFAVGRESLIA